MRHTLAQAEDAGHQAHDAVRDCGTVEEAAMTVREIVTRISSIAMRSQEDRRERIATAVIQGLLTNGGEPASEYEHLFAKDVLRTTDAMIKALDEKEQE